MGWLDRWRTATAVATLDAAPGGPAFAIDVESIPPSLFGLATYEDQIAPVARVSRGEAIQCPAVKRVRDLIAGAIGSLPLQQLDSDFIPTASPLLEQPEAAVPRSVTMTQTVEDMLFEGVAWWRVVERQWAPDGRRGWPTKVRRLLPTSVTVSDDLKVYVRGDGSQQGQAWEYVEDADLIRFHSPNDALLVAGARAIRTILRLDAAAANRAEAPLPSGYFRTVEGVDPTDAAVTEYLTAWKRARQAGAIAWVPAWLEFVPVTNSARDDQLAEARQHAVLEIARLAGVDPEDLGVSTTSRTYQNGQERRRDLLDFTLGGYISAVQDRLSMKDVTPRGYTVRADYNGFLRSNDKERFETYALGRDLGLYGPEEIQRREELPPYSPPAETAPVRPLRAVPADEETPMAASGDAGPTFEDSDQITTLTFEGDVELAFEVDVEARTIYGLAVPYGRVARSEGRRHTFSRGSLALPAKPSRVKLLIQHDRSQAVGRAVELTEDEHGLWAKFKVARGDAGDRALAMAADEVWDGLSIGTAAGGQFEDRGGVRHWRNIPLAEVSLTPFPAFGDARISAVAAEADDTRGTTMTGTETGTDITTPAQEAGPTFDMTALAAAVAAQLAQVPAQGTAPAVEAPEPVAAGGPVFVAEEQPYRFEASRGFVSGGAHDFSSDLQAASRGDYHAQQRVLGFMGDALKFDVDTTDGAALNPSRNRPDLFVDARSYNYPLWSAVRKETLSDLTPMVLPKKSSSSGLVSAHTQGTEPTPGAYAVTAQTISPGAHSGKVEITRELWDQAGTPRVSNLIWNDMVKAWFESLEAKVVTTLDAASPTGITVTTAAADDALSDSLASAFVALQFARGGFGMDTFAVQIDLYKALAQAVDGDGRPLFPMLNPSNANGTTGSRFARMNVHGVDAFPAWALAATGTVAASSYLFDRSSIYAAASTPDRLEWNFGATVQSDNLTQLAYVTLGIWAYSVVAITDLTGVREVIYDPAA